MKNYVYVLIYGVPHEVDGLELLEITDVEVHSDAAAAELVMEDLVDDGYVVEIRKRQLS